MGELSDVFQASRASIIGQRGKWSTAFCLDPRGFSDLSGAVAQAAAQRVIYKGGI